MAAIRAVKGIDSWSGSASLSASSAPTRGKTTTLKGHHRGCSPSRGGRSLRRQDITGKPAFLLVRRGLSMVPRDAACSERSPRGKIWPWAAYTRNDHAAVRSDVERVYGLSPAEGGRSKPREPLSGGEQDAGEGRAMMSRPKLLLLDEP